MVVVAAGCRSALVMQAAWAIFLLSCTNGCVRRGANFSMLYISCATWKQQRLLERFFVHSSFSSIIAASFCSNVKASSLIGKSIAMLCYELVL